MQSYRLLSSKLERLHEYDGVLFGLLPFEPDQFSSNNRLIGGMPGTGKTLQFCMIMQSQLPWPRAQPRPGGRHQGLRVRGVMDGAPSQGLRRRVYQSIVYDAKSQQVARLMTHGFTPGLDLFVLNPLDTSGMVWDIASDITEHVHAQEFASLLVSNVVLPHNLSSASDHFYKTARAVVTDVVQVLQRTRHWRLRDLINCLKTRERIEEVTRLHPEGPGGRSQHHLNKTDESESTLSTLAEHVNQFALVAACWDAIERVHGKGRMLSLNKWVRDGGGTVLVLPDGDEHPTITKPFNRFIMQRLKYLMMKPDQLNRGLHRTIFIDELPTAGKIDCLVELLNKGRDYGLSVTLGIQDIHQMYAVYGREVTEAIVNACGYKAWMKCLGSMAEFASQQIGRQMIEYQAPNTGFSRSRSDGQSQSYKEQSKVWLDSYNDSSSQNLGFSTVRGEQHAFMPAYFTQMPDIHSTGKVPGVYSAPNGRIWSINIPLDLILHGILRDTYLQEKHHHAAAAVDEITGGDQVLAPLTIEDCRRLQIPPSIAGAEDLGSADDPPPRDAPQRPRKSAKKKRPPDSFF